MELALSLGGDHHAVPKPFSFLDHHEPNNKDLGFCMGLGSGRSSEEKRSDHSFDGHDHDQDHPSDPPVQLDLLPFSPVPRAHQPSSSQLRFPWLTDKLMPERGCLENHRLPAVIMVEEADDGAALSSSPNNSTTVSSFQMDFGVRNRNNKRDLEMESERASSRASDDEDNALTRKKLRLSKEQSAFLEESFKEHSTLNPKQKLALAKQLNLRPRQVEVWFQNRRARTKLKQTEVDCEYLKRCCETLTEENRRLQKELQELRALKTSQPFYMQLPATTLTMCPSCERVATTTTTATTTNSSSSAVTTTITTAAADPATAAAATNSISSITKPRLMFPFSHAQPHMQHQAQAH